MLYLLFALTFLAGILFYGMSPREDKLNLDTNQAEGMIVSFLNQHQAAKDYVYAWMGVGPNDGAPPSNVKQELQNESFLRAEPIGSVFDFMSWFPSVPGEKGIKVTADICIDELNKVNKGRPGKENDPSGCFVSRVVCVNNSGAWVQNCADPTVKERYVVTYGGWAGCDGTNCNRPGWWPSESVRVRKFERWRKAMANRTRGSISCGTLYKNGAAWCIDNGETVFKQEGVAAPVCLNPVPNAVINVLPYTETEKDDLFLCYSKIKPTLRSYVSGMRDFFDGFSNSDLGKHTNANNSTWKNLAGGSDMSNIQWNRSENKPYLLLNASSFLNTGISLGDTFTLTIIVDTPAGTTNATLLGLDNIVDPVFKKTDNAGADVFQIIKPGGTPDGESACNNAEGSDGKPETKDRIVSWTMVVQPCTGNPANSCITVYENAGRHDPKTVEGVEHGIFGPIHQSPNGHILTLSTDDELKIYGIRYYPRVLTPQEILQNFKVDQKRFGIADYMNGKLKSCIVIDDYHCSCTPININAGGE